MKSIFSCPEHHWSNKENDQKKSGIWIVLYTLSKHFHIHFFFQSTHMTTFWFTTEKAETMGILSRIRQLGRGTTGPSTQVAQLLQHFLSGPYTALSPTATVSDFFSPPISTLLVSYDDIELKIQISKGETPQILFLTRIHR